MTFRETELFIEGRRERDDWALEVLAWVQANLINVHVGKGRRVRPDQLLPRSTKRRKQADAELEIDAGDDPKDRVEASKRRARERAEREDAERFQASPEGRRMVALLDDAEE